MPTSGGGDGGCPKHGDVRRRRRWWQQVPQAVTSDGGGCPGGAAAAVDLGTRERERVMWACRARRGCVSTGLSPLTSVGDPLADCQTDGS
jgi:hypothetical protein